MSKIKEIIARDIEDSRGNPTIEVELEINTPSGWRVTASVPSGASTGENEALELRDADGCGVSLAIKNVNEIIAPKLKGKDVLNQRDIDDFLIKLDGTENKLKLGANAILGVSMAVCRAGAGAKKVPLYKHIAEITGNKEKLFVPLAMFNILNGGIHAKNELDIQEFMVVPQKETFQENLVLCNKVFQNLKVNIEKNYPSTGSGQVEMGDEGGFAPKISKTEQALFLLKEAIGGESIKIALDCAASEFYNPSTSSGGKYNLDGRDFTRSELLEFYEDLVKRFPIVSLEDPFRQNDWEGWKLISNFKFQIPNLMIVGDDLTTTNIKTIKEAHNKQAINAVLIKLNQIGSVSETIDAINMTKSFNWKTIVSHRSGETMDDFIADLAVGTGADFIKSGSPAKPERMIKYQRLLEIETELK